MVIEHLLVRLSQHEFPQKQDLRQGLGCESFTWEVGTVWGGDVFPDVCAIAFDPPALQIQNSDFVSI